MTFAASVKERALRAIDEKVFPGCCIGIIREGETEVHPFGRETYDESSPDVRDDTAYDLASITKSIPIATLALQLIDERRLSLDDRVAKYLPQYAGGFREAVTLKHLLTYAIDGPRLSLLKDKSADEIEAYALSYEPSKPPGAGFNYSNYPALLLGFVLERVLGRIPQAAQERIFRPLDMNATTFEPHGAAPTEIDGNSIVRDIVHDESARAFARAGRAVGHAGLFSDVPDLLRYFEVLLRDDGAIFSKRIVDEMTTNQIAGLGDATGLGWELDQAHFMGARRSPRTFGKTGFTGTSVVCDMERQTALVILSNRTYPKRPEDATAINRFRSDLCDIVFS